MNKITLSLLAIVTCFALQAQQQYNYTPVAPSVANKTNSANPKEYIQTEKAVAPSAAPQTLPVYVPSKTSVSETILGTTTYDLQTNSSIQRRIFNHGNGTLSAVFTFSASYDLAATDRGTGYSFFDGTQWSTAPNKRIETEKSGWPNIMATSGGKEIIVCHSNISEALAKNERTTVGSGTWSQTTLTTFAAELWPKMVVGGATSNTIHLIALTAPEGSDFGGSLYKGMDGALLYYRSTNGGTTWDIVDNQLPGLDSSNYNSIGGDSYSIDAKDSIVAVVQSVVNAGVTLWKSLDNGQTWTKSDVVTPDIKKFDASKHIILDSLPMYGSDGSSSVLIDNDGMCHVFFGIQLISNEDTTDELISYKPGINAIDYWNEGMGSSIPVKVAGAIDLDGDSIITLDLESYSLPKYGFSGLASYPSTAIDDNNCIYLTYSAVDETKNSGAQYYRHVYVVKSCDGGCLWSAPVDITTTDYFGEFMFASVARKVDNNVHVVCQKDSEPGIAVSGDEDAFGINEIIYLKVPVSDLSSNLYASPSITPIITYDNGTFSATNTGDSLQWYINGIEVSGETGQDYTPNNLSETNGKEITVAFFTPYGCSALSDVVIGGVNDIKSITNEVFTLFPNPSNGQFELFFPKNKKEHYQIEVKNMLGQVMVKYESQNNSSNDISIDISYLNKGIYFLSLKSTEMESIQKIIIN